MHIIYFFFTLLKTTLYYLNIFLIQNLSFDNLLFLIGISFYIVYLRKKILLNKNYYNNFFKEKDYSKEEDKLALADHILQYQFKNKKDRYFTFVFLIISFICYISMAFFFRVKNLANIIDLKKIYSMLLALYNKMNILILIYNLIILFLCIYALLLTLHFIKKFYLKHVMKAHFYLAEEGSWYQKFIDKKSYSNKLYLIRNKLGSYYTSFYSTLFYKIAKEEHLSEFEPKPKVDALYIKYQKFLNVSSNLIRNIPYNLHYICFFFILLFDLFFNDLVLLHVVYFLPIMFIFHLYVIYCKFVRDKSIFGLGDYINKFFYHEIIVINRDWMTIDGLPCETYREFPFDFLEYEMKGFNK